MDSAQYKAVQLPRGPAVFDSVGQRVPYAPLRLLLCERSHACSAAATWTTLRLVRPAATSLVH